MRTVLISFGLAILAFSITVLLGLLHPALYRIVDPILFRFPSHVVDYLIINRGLDVTEGGHKTIILVLLFLIVWFWTAAIMFFLKMRRGLEPQTE